MKIVAFLKFPLITIKVKILIVLLFSNRIDAQISLIRENVFINIKENLNVQIHVDFHFQNPKDDKINLAFPVSQYVNYDQFEAYVNDHKVHTKKTLSKSKETYYFGIHSYPGYYKIFSSKHPLKKHNLFIKYKPSVLNLKKEEGYDGYYIEYILRTGQLWGSNLEFLSIDIILDKNLNCENLILLQESFAGECISKNRWHYQGQDIKLDKDLRLIYR